MRAKVLLATRLAEREDPTARAAAKLAARTGSELVLVYVARELATVPELRHGTDLSPEELRARIFAEIEREIGDYRARNSLPDSARARIEEGDVVERLGAVAVEEGAEYLVIGMEGRGALSRLILGSTAEAILRRAPCPVLVVPSVVAE